MFGKHISRRSALLRGVLVGTAVLALTACGSPGAGNGSGDEGAFTPTETVAMMVPAPPGGGSDMMVRSFASYFASLDQGQSRVDNYEGTLAYEMIVGEHEGDPNLVAGSTASPSFIWKDSLDVPWTWRDFTQLAVFGLDTQYLIVSADSEFKTFEDLADAAESRTLTLAQAGSGGMNTVAAHQLEEAMDTEFEPVIFESGGEQLISVLAGDVDVAAMDPGEFIAQLDAGEVRALVCLCNEANPAPQLADIPTPADEGLDVSFVNQFRAFIGAKGISEEARQYWVDAIAGWQKSPFFEEYVAASLITPVLFGGADADAYIEEAESAYKALLAP